MKKFAIIVLIAMFHFAACLGIVAISMTAASALNQAQATLAFRVLVAATRVLHFPIITLSWYSRQWFPGDWIYVPMAINSVLWAAVIYLLAILVTKLRKIYSHGK